jgi:hypothetical protein
MDCKKSMFSKIFILSQLIYGFNVIPIKIQMAFFREVDKNCSKIYKEPQ